MTLRQKQSKFVVMIALLITKATALGFEMSFGDAYRSVSVPYGHPNSLHRARLALDLNLYRDGRYLTKTEDHLLLGEYWESIGGSWGGRFGDGNHYSLKHEDMR